MMLRSRNMNNANANKVVKDEKEVIQKRAVKKHLHDVEPNNMEPKAKRPAVNDIFQGIENFVIDSTKKQEVKRVSKRHDVDALPSVAEESLVQDELDPCPLVDFDKEVAMDVHAVSEFAADIFKYYKSREKEFQVDNYMKRQTITKYNRASLVDWMVEIQETFELNHETLYLAIKLIDMYLCKETVTVEQLQIIACGTLLIASKFDERSPPLLDDFVYIAEDTFTREDLIKIEMKILNVVGFDLGAPLSYRYLRRYSRVMHGDMETLTLARYILETIQMFYDFVTMSESKVAAATFLLALKMRSPKAKWTDVLHKYSGYQEEELIPVLNTINHAMHIRSTGLYRKLGTVYSKYSHEVFYHSANVPLLSDALSNTTALQ